MTYLIQRRMGLILATTLALCWPNTMSRAADLKPDAVVKSRNIDARVFLDDKIKVDAALAADCLAEGRKWLDKNAADAATSRKQDPQFFRDGG